MPATDPFGIAAKRSAASPLTKYLSSPAVYSQVTSPLCSGSTSSFDVSLDSPGGPDSVSTVGTAEEYGFNPEQDSGFSDSAEKFMSSDMGASGGFSAQIQATQSPSKRKRTRKSRARTHDPVERVVLKKTRRARANDRERSRMHGLNDALEELRNVLPCDNNGKLTKIETLRTAYNYIVLLRNLVQQDDANQACGSASMVTAAPNGVKALAESDESPDSSRAVSPPSAFNNSGNGFCGQVVGGDGLDLLQQMINGKLYGYSFSSAGCQNFAGVGTVTEPSATALILNGLDYTGLSVANNHESDSNFGPLNNIDNSTSPASGPFASNSLTPYTQGYGGGGVSSYDTISSEDRASSPSIVAAFYISRNGQSTSTYSTQDVQSARHSLTPKLLVQRGHYL